MKLLENILARARQDLVIEVAGGGEEDVFLWEHAERVARSARAILSLPEVASAKPDEAAVLAASLYHDAGWVVRVRQGEAKREEVLVRAVADDHRDLGAALMAKSLAPLLPAESVRVASAVIRTLHERDVDSIEGHVVGDAESLEEFGLLAFWGSIRRGTLDGKGVQAVVDTWHRRRDYQFWAARLRDSFRFDAVRQLARRRLMTYERVMEEVEHLHGGADVAQLGVAPPAEQSQRSAAR